MHTADTYQITVIDLMTAAGEHVMQVGVGFINRDEARNVAVEALTVYPDAGFAIFTTEERRKGARAA